MSKFSKFDTVKHTNRGTFYEVILTPDDGATIERDGIPAYIYYDSMSRKTWIRPASEFEDGRFVLASEMLNNKAVSTQSHEFNALMDVQKAFEALPAVVDDDYPAARHRYESAVRAFLEACGENGRPRNLVHAEDATRFTRDAERLVSRPPLPAIAAAPGTWDLRNIDRWLPQCDAAARELMARYNEDATVEHADVQDERLQAAAAIRLLIAHVPTITVEEKLTGPLEAEFRRNPSMTDPSNTERWKASLRAVLEEIAPPAEYCSCRLWSYPRGPVHSPTCERWAQWSRDMIYHAAVTHAEAWGISRKSPEVIVERLVGDAADAILPTPERIRELCEQVEKHMLAVSGPARAELMAAQFELGRQEVDAMRRIGDQLNDILVSMPNVKR